MREDWEEIEFGELCKFSQGVQVPKGKQYSENNADRVRFLRIVDFTQGNEEPRYIEKPDDSNIVTKEDISMVRYGTVGFVCTGKDGAIANNLFRIIPKIDIVNSYLINYLQSSLFKRHINSKGATMQALSFGLIKPIKIPLSPLPEQRAIVSKIEELFSDLDKGIADLKKAQDQLKVYRQAVLKKAFEELVNKGCDEGLLGDISSKITKGSTPTTYGYKYQKEGINFIKIENVIQGRIDKKSIYQFISEEAHESQKRSQLEEGDVLFSIAGTIGETCLITKDILPANTNQAFAIISGFNKVLDANFLRKQLDSFVSRKLKDKARGGAMNNVSLTDLKNLKVVIPDMEIQDQVVQEIESRLSVCDKLEESITESLEKAEALRQSILKKAFEGTLLSEEEIAACKAAPDYEPASVLLEKIKAEKKK